MQEEYNTIEPTYFDDAMGFNAFADDETDAGQSSGVACIQIVHFDEVDKPDVSRMLIQPVRTR